MIINKMKSRIKILSPIFLMVIFLLSIQIDSSNAVNIAGNKTNLQAQVDNFPQTFYQTGTSWLNFTFMAFAASNPQANVLISYIPSSTEDIYCREITIFLDNHQVYSTANTAAGMICGTLQTGEINLASYISSTSYNTYHNIQMRLTYGGYGYSWQITNIQLTGGNFEGLTLYSSSGVPFSPGQAELDTSGSTSFGGQCIPGWCANTWTESLASSVEAPPYLAYGSSQLNNYYFSVQTISNQVSCSGLECTGTSAGLYSETVTLSAQTYDSNGPDLSMLGITNSDITNSVSGQTFGGLNWKLGASYGGIDGSLSSYSGSAFSSAVGTGTTSSATSGNGNWRLLGTMQYTVTQLGNWKIASNFLLSANSISLANIFGHNIQFKIVITCVFSSGSGTTDGSQVSPPLTQTLILGNGQGATQENPTSQMNTWIVVTPGCILTGSNQCTSTNTYNG